MGGKTENRSKAKKVYNIVSTTVIALVFVFLVVAVALLLWQRKSGGDSSLFGYYMFEVVSDSMSGTLEKRDVIIAKKLDAEGIKSLKEGDIITFIAPQGPLKGQNITHRIIGVALSEEDGSVLYFSTKGDNKNVGADEWRLSPSNVKAKYVRKSAFVTGLRKFLSHWYGYVVLIALPLCIVVVLIAVGYVRDRLAKENAAAAPQKLSVENMSDEDKQKLLRDYLSSQTVKDDISTEKENRDEKDEPKE